VYLKIVSNSSNTLNTLNRNAVTRNRHKPYWAAWRGKAKAILRMHDYLKALCILVAPSWSDKGGVNY